MLKRKFTITSAKLIKSKSGNTNENFIALKNQDVDNGTSTRTKVNFDENAFHIPEGTGLEPKNDLYLYEEEMEEKMPATSIIQALNDYAAVIPPPNARNNNASFQATNGFDNKADDPRSQTQAPIIKKNKLGTMMGVFLPCIQNIFGVILFLRMNWIVGIAGAFQATIIILICCSVTLITAISMSAIATNGVVPAGGSYFMISRSLGPEFGGAVGFLFYLATTFATAMYTIGAVEIMLEYLAPNMAIVQNRYHNFRIYGACFLLLMTLIVMVGVRLVNKIAAVSLFCVLLSILAIYVGIFAYYKGNPRVQICMVGDQLLSQSLFKAPENCYKFDKNGLPNPIIWSGFCESPIKNATLLTTTKQMTNKPSLILPRNLTINDFKKCNPYFLTHNVTLRPGIPGLASGVFKENMRARYMKPGEANPGEKAMNKWIIQAYIATSFTLLLGIYFPSVTGIMAGSNRSGDLADAQNSIPKGTIAAILFTSSVYVSSALLFAACISNPLLRDKFGQSIGGGMIVANLGWPHPLIVTIGSFLSTIGAALQSLTGAPRLLQAIAKDNIVPFLRWFTRTAKNGEPIAALGLTFTIAMIGIAIGNLDFIAPILTMFFLMCYGFVNLACALQTLLKTPNWRPRFKYYHWFLSLIGLALCVAAMFISSWYYALIAIGIACALYKYIEYYGAEKEWGDGVKGLQLSTALFSLLRYEQQQQSSTSHLGFNQNVKSEWPITLKQQNGHNQSANNGIGHMGKLINYGPQNQQHTKNWRPQLLVLVRFAKASEESARKQLLESLKQSDKKHGNRYRVSRFFPPIKRRSRSVSEGKAVPSDQSQRQPKISKDDHDLENNKPIGLDIDTNNNNINNEFNDHDESHTEDLLDEKRDSFNINDGMLGSHSIYENNSALILTNPRLLSLAHQLKAGHGLTVCASAVKGDWLKDSQEAFMLKDTLKEYMAREKVKGFCDIVMTQDIYSGILDLIQLSGLGGLRHNCVLMGWPTNWKEIRNFSSGTTSSFKQYKSSTGGGGGPESSIYNRRIDTKNYLYNRATGRRDSRQRFEANVPSWKVFIDVVRAVHAGNMALMVMKGADAFPTNKTRLPPGSTIDVWWIVHDGGLLMLLPFLLKQHKVWRNCTMRIFTVAQLEDNSVLLKKNLEKFIYSLRLKAQVEVVEMHKSDISAYTYERTLLMEQRSQLLRQLNLSRKESLAVVQNLADIAHERTSLPLIDKPSSADKKSTQSSNLLALPNSQSVQTVNQNNLSNRFSNHQLQNNIMDHHSNITNQEYSKSTSDLKTITSDNSNGNSASLEAVLNAQETEKKPMRASIIGNESMFEQRLMVPSKSNGLPSIPVHTIYGENKGKSNLPGNDENQIGETDLLLNNPEKDTIQPLTNTDIPNKGNGSEQSLESKLNTEESKKDFNNNICIDPKAMGINNPIITDNGTAKPFGEYNRNALNKIDAANVKRMHAAIKLNQTILERSKEAQLVLLNMPGPPRNQLGDENYMEYLEVLTEGLPRVLLIRGSGQEVVTIYS